MESLYSMGSSPGRGPMRATLGTLFVAAVVSAAIPLRAADENDRKAPFPLPEAAPKRDWEWDEDERFDELMEQLAINEASLDAVEIAIAKKTRRKATQQGEARRQDANSRMMDRKGGGPMKWDEFYGTNAEKFFYHPVDPNTTYRTDTFLRQMGKAEDDKTGEDTPSRQSVPVHQRPPQWDYIYRANKTARDNALADASIAESEIERLEQRRTELEKEQAVLWCKLAFRAVQRLNVARKPLLRFELISAAGGDGNAEHTKALSAAARFLATSLAVVEKAEQEQSVAFGGVAGVVTQARESFEDSLLEVSDLESEWESTKTDLGKFYKLSQMLADKAKTLAESYTGAMDGDMNKESARKERFRGMLQESVVEYAQILLALNELTDKLKTDWKVRVDTKQKVKPLKLAWGPSSSLDNISTVADRDEPQTDRKGTVVDQKLLRKAFAASRAAYDQKTGVLTLGYDFKKRDQLKDFDVSNATPELGGNGTLRIRPGDTLPHIARFRKGQASFRVKFEKVDIPFLTAGPYQLRYDGGYYTRTFRMRCPGDQSVETDVGKTDPVEGGEAGKVYTVSLLIGERRCTLKVVGNNNTKECGVVAAPGDAFGFTFDGNTHGVIVGDLQLQGEADPEWLQSLFQK